MPKTPHQHNYTKETTKKVPLAPHGHDILAQRQCSCGARQTYDIKERIK